MEAAGLVLGVIPLAIKALGTYRDILSAMKNIKRDLEYMIRDLNTEQQILQNTCETLLKGIAPDSMLDDMIEDPFGPSWSQYNNEVRLRLWRSANVFQELVEEMKKAAIELREKLAIDQNGKTRLVDRRSLLDELKHSAYFTLKKKDYNEIMSRLKGGNAVLNTLAHQNSNLEPDRRSRSEAKLARLIRKLSRGIYAALQSVIICDCTDSHNLGLEIAPRKDVMLPGDEEDEAAKSLDFCVAVRSRARNQLGSQRWEKVRVQLAADETTLPTPPTKLSTDLPRSRSPRLRWPSLPTIRSSQTRASVLNTPTQSTSHLSASMQITNLCGTLHKGKGKATVQDSYGYIFNKASKFNLFHQDSQGCDPENLSAITLRTILDDHSSGRSQFTYGERLRVALALSYSVLHLYSTPWLAKVVTPDDIIFLREQQAPDTYIYHLDRPFLVKTPPKSSASASLSQPPQAMLGRPMDPIILSLGLLLIQVIVGRHIDNLDLDPDVRGIGSILDKQSAASQMTLSVLENGGMNYAGAVQWCLDSVLCGAGLDDEKVGQDFHKLVIAKLEADMRLQALTTSTA